MSTFTDLLAKAQQLELELNKFAQGELGLVKDLAKELRENLELAVKHEVGAAEAPVPPANAGSGVQTSADLRG